MHQLSMTNTTIQKILSNLTDAVFNNDEVIEQLRSRCVPLVDGRRRQNEESNFPGLKSYSNEYLYKALECPVDEYCFPRCAYGVDTTLVHAKSVYWNDIVSPFLKRIVNYTGSPSNALTMFYPEKGYIGWHHNGNAAGYNFLMTYSIDGDGYFKYYDQHTDKFTVLQDVPGWNFRFGYYPDIRYEKDNLFWHTAYTEKPRLTIGWVVKHREIWKSLLEECTDINNLPFDLDSMGPRSDAKN